MRRNLFLYFLLIIALSCTSNDMMEDDEMSAMEEIMGENNEEEEMMEEMEEEEEEEETMSSLLMGDFISAAHPTSGTATVNSSMTFLNLSEFKSDDGPLLELYLATDVDASEYVSLGVLQGLEGNFSYELPGNIDFSTHKYVLVWCVDFSVNFGHAILE